MAETTTGAGTGQAPNPQPTASGGQAPQPAGQAPNGQTQPTETNQITDERGRPITTLERALELLTETRQEAAEHRRQLRQLQQQQTRAQQEGQTEAQRLAAELETTRAERDRLLAAERAGIVSTVARQVATDLHAVNPVVVARMIQMADVRWDEHDPNKPANIRRLVEQIRDDLPDLFRAGGGDGGTPGKPAKVDMNQLIRGAAGRG